ncbi:hypothetical protein M011DRAFT_288783 [Sporormia fimetaria CBS 119925]|uniref:Secreted protein n=1 Tax=Sporormia fimetaria CBS 119925 TaxID=1340428 RepID=A0A6A6UXY2_9PLEO|nr:hypothetical protein M011DRAFT_288783 [Sporormia fimetaria CBS 119925]
MLLKVFLLLGMAVLCSKTYSIQDGLRAGDEFRLPTLLHCHVQRDAFIYLRPSVLLRMAVLCSRTCSSQDRLRPRGHSTFALFCCGTYAQGPGERGGRYGKAFDGAPRVLSFFYAAVDAANRQRPKMEERFSHLYWSPTGALPTSWRLPPPTVDMWA